MLDTIFNRRSVRKYLDKPVSDGDLQTILKAGMYAPSAKNCRPWHFIVCNNKDSVKEVRELHSYGVSLETAPVAIIVCGDTKLEFMENFHLTDCAAAVQNILLASKELGLDTCWMGIYPKIDLIDSFSKHFGLPENIKPYAMIALGYGAQDLAMPNRFEEDRIHFNEW